MRKFFLSLFIFIGIIEYSNAQITIEDNDGNDLTNTTAFLPSSPEKVIYNITNQGADEITFIVQVVSFTIPADASDIFVCACGNCFPIASSSPPINVGDPTILGPGATYGNNQADVEYLSNGSTGAANITIKVFEQGNESNMAQFTLDTEYSGTNNLNYENLFSIFPNPANNFFTISSNQHFSNSELVFSNILGKTVKKMNFLNNSLQFNSKEFAKGIYFVSLLENKKLLLTKKLVIN